MLLFIIQVIDVIIVSEKVKLNFTTEQYKSYILKYYFVAIVSISTSTPKGKSLTANALRAGGFSV